MGFTPLALGLRKPSSTHLGSQIWQQAPALSPNMNILGLVCQGPGHELTYLLPLIFKAYELCEPMAVGLLAWEL